MCVANSLCGLLKGYGMASSIKWPNDMLVHRKKVAGILIENSIMGQNLDTSIIGIGINVNQTVFPEKLLNPTSLKLESGMEQDPGRLLQELLASLRIRLTQLYSNSLDIIRKDYLNNLWKLNVWSTYSHSHGDFEGRITDISETGELIVKKRSGEILPYQFKEIVFKDET
jgi:BirA family biotin operon repressor/biotin-[acetyl-CoA-carboxylase] ligase